MKPGKRFIAINFLLVMISMGITCKKEGSVISIQGFHMRDPAGNELGHYGPADDDWTIRTSLSEREMALFDFTVSETLDNTAEGTVGSSLVAYPNPVLEMQTYEVQTSGPVLLKLVIVNKDLAVIKTSFVKMKDPQIIIDLSDRSKFPERSSFRVYFSLSAQGKPNFKVGFGDIRICYADANFLEDCF